MTMVTPGWPSEPIPPTREPRAGRGGTIALIVIVVASFVAGAISAVVFFIPLFDSLNAPTYAIPGQVTRHFSSETYVIYLRTGHKSGFGGFNSESDGPIGVAPDGIRVTSADGSRLSTFPVSSDITLTSGSDEYSGALQFVPPEAGEYTVTVDGTAGRFMVERDLEDTITERVGWLLVAGLFGVIFVASGIWLIVRLIRRGRHRQPAYAVAAAAPPGWYADPGGSGSLRYWNGTNWTEHTH